MITVSIGFFRDLSRNSTWSSYVFAMINDITGNLYRFCDFADDCLLYRVIDSQEDTIILQQDLDQLAQWIQTWTLGFNIIKFVVIRCTRSLFMIITNRQMYSPWSTIG